MPDGGNYPFGDREKLFEQTGWLKSEMAALKESQLTEADLLKAEARIVKSFQEALDNWWPYKQMEIDKSFAKSIEDHEKRREREKKQALADAGLEVDATGKAKPKGGWAKNIVSQSSFNTILILIGIAMAIPESRGLLFRFALAFF